MKSKLSKEMRAIRVQLKLHNIGEKEKEELREELRKLKKISQDKNADVKASV